MRIAFSYSYRNADAAAAAEMTKIAEELCHGMALRCIKVYIGYNYRLVWNLMGELLTTATLQPLLYADSK